MQLPVQLPRSSDTHKGDYGCVFVLGGSIGLTGAVCLCSHAALGMGAGLVRVGVPRSLNSIFEVKLTEVMSLPLEGKAGSLVFGAFKKFSESLNKVDCLVLGPGASLKPTTCKLMVKVIKEIDKPMVVDADALTALAQNLDVLKKRKTRHLVLTPHLGEFSRLIKLDVRKIKEKRKELVKKFAVMYNLTLILKGHRTLVTDGKRVFENTSGNPGMATAGSGDVLAGVVSGLIAQGLDCFDAAKLGVHLHGLAGDYAAKDKTQNCLIASDIIEYLPKAIKNCRRSSIGRAPHL